jgi:hypothetical protein
VTSSRSRGGAAEESSAYLYLIDPGNRNQPGSEWQVEENVILEHPHEGELVLEIRGGRRVRR